MKTRDTKVPYQVYVDRDVYEAAKKKAQNSGITIPSVIRAALEKFSTDPVSETVKQIEKHNRRITKK